MSTPQKSGYYSQKAADAGGYCLYETPDGLVVSVTEVIECGETPGSAWDDLIHIGIVTDFVKQMPNAKGEIDEIIGDPMPSRLGHFSSRCFKYYNER